MNSAKVMGYLLPRLVYENTMISVLGSLSCSLICLLREEPVAMLWAFLWRSQGGKVLSQQPCNDLSSRSSFSWDFRWHHSPGCHFLNLALYETPYQRHTDKQCSYFWPWENRKTKAHNPTLHSELLPFKIERDINHIKQHKWYTNY